MATFETDPTASDAEIATPADIIVTLTKLPERQRQLSASLLIPVSLERLWAVLTDYERLAEFIPNLAESTVVGDADGSPLLKQVGVQRFAGINFKAAVVLKMIANPCDRIDFVMVDGDFLRFEGSWCLTAQSAAHTELAYNLMVQAPRYMPVSIIERRLSQDIGVNLDAIRTEACRDC